MLDEVVYNAEHCWSRLGYHVSCNLCPISLQALSATRTTHPFSIESLFGAVLTGCSRLITEPATFDYFSRSRSCPSCHTSPFHNRVPHNHRKNNCSLHGSTISICCPTIHLLSESIFRDGRRQFETGKFSLK